MHSSGGGDVDELKKKTTYSDIHVSCHWISLIFVEVPSPQAHGAFLYISAACFPVLGILGREESISYLPPVIHQLSMAHPPPRRLVENHCPFQELCGQHAPKVHSLLWTADRWGTQNDRTTAMCRMRRRTSTCTKMMQKTSDVA